MDQKKTLFQHNTISKARYALTATQKNIMYLVMSQLSKTDTAASKYYVAVRDLEILTKKQLSYARVKEQVDQLVENSIKFKADNGNQITTTFCSSAEYMVGSGMVEITLSDKIRPYFFELKNNFTTFQASTAISLKSIYSKRLYEFLSAFKNLNSYKISITALKKMLYIIDEKGHDKYERPSLFIDRVIKVAQKELAKDSDLKFTYRTEKKGRKVETIEFIIEYLPVQSKLDFSQDDQKGHIFKRLTDRFKLRRDQAERIISAIDIGTIHKTCYNIELKYGRQQNIGAVTAKIFNVSEKGSQAKVV